MSLGSASLASCLVTKPSLWINFLPFWNWIFKLSRLIGSHWPTPGFLVPLLLHVASGPFHLCLDSNGILFFGLWSQRVALPIHVSTPVEPTCCGESWEESRYWSVVFLELISPQGLLSGKRQISPLILMLRPTVLDTNPQKHTGWPSPWGANHIEHISIVMKHGSSNLLGFPDFGKKKIYWCSEFCTMMWTPHGKLPTHPSAFLLVTWFSSRYFN